MPERRQLLQLVVDVRLAGRVSPWLRLGSKGDIEERVRWLPPGAMHVRWGAGRGGGCVVVARCLVELRDRLFEDDKVLAVGVFGGLLDDACGSSRQRGVSSQVRHWQCETAVAGSRVWGHMHIQWQVSRV